MRGVTIGTDMALQKQKTVVRRPVAVDFPVMPRLPSLTITKDNEALQQHQGQMDQWYAAHRQAVLDKIGQLQDQIDTLSSAMANYNTQTKG